MCRKLYLMLFVLLFSILFHTLNTRAAVFKRSYTEISADSIRAAIERGDSVIIDNCEIFGPLIKIGTLETPDTVRNLISITRSTFYDTVSFLRCNFLKDISFDSTIFLEKVSFSYTIFSGATVFSGVTFRNPALFSYSTFTGYADFSGAIFRKGTAFVSAIFSEDASFNGDSISGAAVFYEVRFRKSAYFMGANFSGEAYFTKATFSGDVFFRNASFEEANFLEAQFSSVVDFSLKEFKNIYISWKQLEGHLWYNPTANLKLMRYFEEQRMLADADGVYLFLKDQERMEKPWYIRYPEYWLIQLTCGYGVKPQNTLYASLVIILLFAIFYTKSGAMRARTQDFAVRRAMRKAVKKVSFYHALYFSLQTFIIGVVTDWYPTEHYLIKIKRIKLFKFKTLAMIEGALGWILVILFIISLGKKFIR